MSARYFTRITRQDRQDPPQNPVDAGERDIDEYTDESAIAAATKVAQGVMRESSVMGVEVLLFLRRQSVHDERWINRTGDYRRIHTVSIGECWHDGKRRYIPWPKPI